MAKKADLEAAYARWREAAAAADRAERDRDYHAVIRSAVDGLLHLREAIGYQRRYLGTDRPSIPTVDQLLGYAPPLFARHSLDALGGWLGQAKKAERDMYPDLPERLHAARRAMAHAARLWSDLHGLDPPSRPHDPEGGREADAAAIRVWVAIGAVARTRPGAGPYTPVTDLRREGWGKCPGCGHAHRANYAALLGPLGCPRCGRAGQFVITKHAV